MSEKGLFSRILKSLNTTELASPGIFKQRKGEESAKPSMDSVLGMLSKPASCAHARYSVRLLLGVLSNSPGLSKQL
jgi:hypothetical protein